MNRSPGKSKERKLKTHSINTKKENTKLNRLVSEDQGGFKVYGLHISAQHIIPTATQALKQKAGNRHILCFIPSPGLSRE